MADLESNSLVDLAKSMRAGRADESLMHGKELNKAYDNVIKYGSLVHAGVLSKSSKLWKSVVRKYQRRWEKYMAENSLAEPYMDMLYEQARVLDRHYADGNSIVPDHEYDLLITEIERCEEMFPSLMSADSPTSKVRDEKSEKLAKVEHKKPMLSICNAYSEDEIREWALSIEGKLSEGLGNE